jgi:ribosome maturation factor RimP
MGSGRAPAGGGSTADDGRLAGVRSAAERVARSYDLDIFDLQLRRESIGLVLRVTIDRPLRREADGRVHVERPEESIGIEECQQVSQDLSAILDVEDALDAAYTLEVSSPGLERPLRGVEDYDRFAGRLAKVVVREAVDGQMHFEGRLDGVEGDAVVLTVGRRKVVRLPLGNIARARLAVEF